MSYTINHYNGTLLTTVSDGTIDASTDLTLIGKNYAGYGQAQNDNFVWLLENFSSSTQPPKPLTGQIWFDSGNSKLKFWDGNKFRTTGGAEISAFSSPPTGLTVGDFWFDTTNNQLYAYTGNGSSPFTLIGPQAVSGSATTEMRSVSVTDTNGTSHAIIQAIDNGSVVFVVSEDSSFTLDSTINPITGFTTIQQGLTLVYTNNNATPGVTTSSHRFWGTSTNADKLGGLSASSFVQTGSASFTTTVNFADSGYTVGNPVARLAVFNNGSSTPTIANLVGNTIAFQTTVSSATKYPLNLVGNDMLPGVTLTSNIGSSTLLWNNVYANYVYSTAAQADSLSVSGTYRTASTAASANTIAARDASGNITAANFNGTATSAYYADLAEKYLADAEYDVGTVVKVGGEKEVTAATLGDQPIGVVSANPAFKMNEGLVGGTYIALKGRVPVKVWGTCSKGDCLTSTGSGYAISVDTTSPNIFAVALEDSTDADVTLVECVVL
jgi:hypothetical protein